MTRRPFGLGALGVVLLGVLGFLWLFSSNSFLISPDAAKPLAPRVQVQGERPSGPGGVYYVDVLVRRASWLERLVKPLRPDGSVLVPEDAIQPPGANDSERRQQSLREMARSEQVAAAVALRQLGYKVDADPNGVIVDAVAADAPATGKLQPTDVIVRADGKPVHTPGDLRRIVGAHTPGEKVRLGLRTKDGTRELTVGTIPNPDDRSRAIIGIAVTQSADIQLPVKVRIDLGDVGGPSAGLAFALDVMEELGRNVDRGYKVAATGEIELDGAVAPIGGAAQKALGARRAGVDVFLVPAGDNAREARKTAGDMKVIPVSTFQQALRALATLPRKA
jgi:PDZ domain-containing protein